MLGGVSNLVLEMPPQHGKSTYMHSGAIPWVLGLRPSWNGMLASYSESLASSFSSKARDVYRAWAPALWGTTIGAKDASTEWHTTRGGEFFAAGVGGGFTGRGANFAIVDDAIKNWVQAQSPGQRQAVWDWYTSSLLTRMHPEGGIMVLIGTRWHQQDLPGLAMKQWEEDGEPYLRIRFPALAEKGDSLGRAEGEPLWPESGRIREWYLRKKRAQGSLMFEAIFQQNPKPGEDALYREQWFRTFQIRGEYVIPSIGRPIHMGDLLIFQTVDLAIKQDERANRYVIVTYGLSPLGEVFVLDVYADRVPFVYQIGKLALYAAKWTASLIGIENNAFQDASVQSAVAEGLPAVGVTSTRDKGVRAIPMAAVAEAGRLYLLEGAPWRQETIDELCGFPNAGEDDIFDAFSLGGRMMIELAGMRAASGFADAGLSTTQNGIALASFIPA